MTEQGRASIREAVSSLTNEAHSKHAELISIPANARTGEGYDRTVDFLYDELSAFADAAHRITVPDSYLRDCWGEDRENVRDYLTVERFQPRRIATAQLNGSSDEIGIHLTNNYDIYWGPKKERAGTVAQLMAFKALQISGVSLKKSIFLSATPDAYIGGESGAGYVASAEIGRSDQVLSASLGGPNLITVGFKGMVWAKIAIRGRAAHGARAHEGRNAIEAMMLVQSRIMEMSRAYSSQISPVPISPAEASAPSITMCRIAGNLDSSFVAPDCALYLDRRLNPDETVMQAVSELETLVSEVRKETGFEISLSIPHTVEPSYTDPDSALYCSLAQNLREATGQKPEHVVWSHYLGLHYFTGAWGSEAIAYTPGIIGHDNVNPDLSDDMFDLETLVPTIEAIALTAYDLASCD